MQSPQVANLFDSNSTTEGLFAPTAVKGEYSPLRVLRSAAGFYVGTIFQEFDAEGKVVFEEPGSRDTGYFATEELASAFLADMEDGDFDEDNIRLFP